MSKRFLVLIALLLLGFFIAGCSEGDNSNSVQNPNPNTFSPTGSISGVVFDECLEAPVAGAVVSVAYAGRVHQVTTTSNGAFSFAGVPATELAGDDLSWEGDGYEVTCDLTKVTGYGIAFQRSVGVYFSTLEDGTNDELYSGVQEGGNGQNTPVNNLAATVEFEVSTLNASISGTLYDVSTGRALTGATVALYLGGNFMATTTASATGTYTFDNVPAISGYSLLVTKAGYEYAALQAANTVSGVSCGRISLSCSPGCNQDLAGVDVNLIANPAKDKTVPYVVSVATGGEEDVINGDDFPSLTNADIDDFVLVFSESMAAERSVKKAVGLVSSFTVVATSGGPNDVTQDDTLDIIDSYTVAMTSSGVMTIDLTYMSDADIIDFVIAANALPWDADATTVVIGGGSYTLTLTPGTHLTDASFIPWYAASDKIGALGTHTLDNGFLHAFGEAYQDAFIFSTTPATGVGVMTITVND